MSGEAPFEVITIGRVGVDIYPLQIGVGLEDVTTFGKYLGGSATNVAVAALVSAVAPPSLLEPGDDPFGRFVHQALEGFGVDDRFVSSVPPISPTPVVFRATPRPTTSRWTSTASPKHRTWRSERDELDLDASGCCRRAVGDGAPDLSDEPSREATLAALPYTQSPAPDDPRPRLPTNVLGFPRSRRVNRCWPHSTW